MRHGTKKTIFEELVAKVSNPLKITIGANVLDFDPSRPEEVAYVEKLGKEQAAFDNGGAEKVLVQLWIRRPAAGKATAEGQAV